MRFAWIKQHDEEFPITVMCKVLQVSDSGYYDRLKHKPSAAWQRRQTIAQAVARFYFESQRIYGYRKVYEDLRQAETNCCRENGSTYNVSNRAVLACKTQVCADDRFQS